MAEQILDMLRAVDECDNPKCQMCPRCIQLFNEAMRALEYGFRLVNDRKGEGDFSPAKFVTMAEDVFVNRHAVALGRKGGLANKGIPKPASAANGSKGGRPKGSKNKPKPQPQSV